MSEPYIGRAAEAAARAKHNRIHRPMKKTAAKKKPVKKAVKRASKAFEEALGIKQPEPATQNWAPILGSIEEPFTEEEMEEGEPWPDYSPSDQDAKETDEANALSLVHNQVVGVSSIAPGHIVPESISDATEGGNYRILKHGEVILPTDQWETDYFGWEQRQSVMPGEILDLDGGTHARHRRSINRSEPQRLPASNPPGVTTTPLENQKLGQTPDVPEKLVHITNDNLAFCIENLIEAINFAHSKGMLRKLQEKDLTIFKARIAAGRKLVSQLRA